MTSSVIVFFMYRRRVIALKPTVRILIVKKEIPMTQKMDMYLQCLEIIHKCL